MVIQKNKSTKLFVLFFQINTASRPIADSFPMKSAHIRTLSLLLFTALLLLAAPAVADSSQSTDITLTVCEVAVVKDLSAQDIVFSIDGTSGRTSTLVVKGGSVTIDVLSSIPFGKKLTFDPVETRKYDTELGEAYVFSNIPGDMTVTMKLEPGGGSITPSTPGTPVTPETPDTPGDDPGTSDDESHTALVGDNGDAHFKDHEVIIRVTVPEKYAGKKIEVIDGASVEAADHMDIYHQADIHLHFELEDGDKALVHFRIPASEFKAKGLTENDACLYHYDEDSGWTKLPTWHVTSGEYLIYESETDDFSPFAIVFEENSAMSKDTEEPVTPAELPVYLGIALLTLILLAGIGTVILRRRKNVEKQ